MEREDGEKERIWVGGRRGGMLELCLRWAGGKGMLDGAHV